jgi:hypothetical protein
MKKMIMLVIEYLSKVLDEAAKYCGFEEVV